MPQACRRRGRRRLATRDRVRPDATSRPQRSHRRRARPRASRLVMLNRDLAHGPADQSIAARTRALPLSTGGSLGIDRAVRRDTIFPRGASSTANTSPPLRARSWPARRRRPRSRRLPPSTRPPASHGLLKRGDPAVACLARPVAAVTKGRDRRLHVLAAVALVEQVQSSARRTQPRPLRCAPGLPRGRGWRLGVAEVSDGEHRGQGGRVVAG